MFNNLRRKRRKKEGYHLQAKKYTIDTTNKIY
jgi:hypothetical protein